MLFMENAIKIFYVSKTKRSYNIDNDFEVYTCYPGKFVGIFTPPFSNVSNLQINMRKPIRARGEILDQLANTPVNNTPLKYYLYFNTTI